MSSALTHVGGVAVSDLLQAEGLPDQSGDVVFVSGSLIAGYGNAWSDIDMFVVGGRDPVGDTIVDATTHKISLHVVGDRRVDFEFWSRAAVQRTMDKVVAAARRRRGVEGATGPAELQLLHRIHIGRVLQNSRGFAALREGIDVPALRSYLIDDALRDVDGMHEDVCGMLESGDTQTGALHARGLVDRSVDAYCHAHGNLDPTRKWRLHHLRACTAGAATQFLSEYWRVQFPGAATGMDDGACREHVVRCLDLSRRLIDAASERS